MTDEQIDALCPVCLVEHDPEIHRATVSVHRYLRERMKLVTNPPEIPTVKKRKEPRKVEVGA